MANLKPINEEFSNSSYNNDSRLSQPSSGVRQVRNVQTDKSYDPDKRRGGAEERAASTWGASMQASENKAQQTDQKNQARGIRSVGTAEYQNAGQKAVQTGRSTMSAGKRILKKNGKGSDSGARKKLDRSVTLSIWSWGFFIWMWFQIPFTILSIIFMGLTEAIYQFSTLLEPTVENGMVVTILKDGTSALLSFFSWVAGNVLDVFGINIELLNPANFFMITHVLLVFVGWGMLLAMGIIYTMTGQKAFSGKGAGGKNAVFILAFVGYAIPILNILPLFFFWTLMVLKNPR